MKPIAQSENLATRLERAASWIAAARNVAPSQLHEAFIFLYIAFNAMAGRQQYEGTQTAAREDIQRFLKRVRDMTTRDRLSGQDRLRQAMVGCRRDIETLIRDHFLVDGLFRGIEPRRIKDSIQQELRRGGAAFDGGDEIELLRLVLSRLTVLRNRVMHGCVTYGSKSKGLPSIVKGQRVAGILIPTVHDLMTTHGSSIDWDPIPYPRVGFEDPLERH